METLLTSLTILVVVAIVFAVGSPLSFVMLIQTKKTISLLKVKDENILNNIGIVLLTLASSIIYLMSFPFFLSKTIWEGLKDYEF